MGIDYPDSHSVILGHVISFREWSVRPLSRLRKEQQHLSLVRRVCAYYNATIISLTGQEDRHAKEKSFTEGLFRSTSEDMLKKRKAELEQVLNKGKTINEMFPQEYPEDPIDYAKGGIIASPFVNTPNPYKSMSTLGGRSSVSLGGKAVSTHQQMSTFTRDCLDVERDLGKSNPSLEEVLKFHKAKRVEMHYDTLKWTIDAPITVIDNLEYNYVNVDMRVPDQPAAGRTLKDIMADNGIIDLNRTFSFRETMDSVENSAAKVGPCRARMGQVSKLECICNRCEHWRETTTQGQIDELHSPMNTLSKRIEEVEPLPKKTRFPSINDKVAPRGFVDPRLNIDPIRRQELNR